LAAFFCLKCANICANIFKALMFILPEKSQKIENEIMDLDPPWPKKISFLEKSDVYKMRYYLKSWSFQ
jgi:hypothetical protein